MRWPRLDALGPVEIDFRVAEACVTVCSHSAVSARPSKCSQPSKSAPGTGIRGN
jgi:hypothetical protein